MPSSASSEHHAMLRWPRGDDQERPDQRAERGSDVAADLEERLREAVASARRHPRDAGRLRVEHRRADAHQAAAASSIANVPATDSNSRPTSVNPMPTTSAYGVGRRSV